MRLLRRLSWGAVAAVLVLLLCQEWFGPDIWYHLYLGGRIARTGAAQPADRVLLQQPGFINLYWLFQLAARAVFGLGGIPAVSLLFVGLWAAILAVWLRTAGLLRIGAAGPWLALAAVLVCQVRFEPRPEIFSYLFLALQIRWLAAWKLDQAATAGELARFAVVEAFWANMHGYFAFGPLLVGLRLAAAPPGSRGWRSLWTLLGLTVAASIASPFGLHNWTEVGLLWRFFGAMRHQIREFLPPGEPPQIDLWQIRLFWACWLAVLGAGLVRARRAGWSRCFALLLAAVGLYLSAQAVRNIPLLVLFSAPLLGEVLPGLPWARREGAVRLALVATGAALSCWIVTGGFDRFIKAAGGFGLREAPRAFPAGFADYANTTGFAGSVLTTGMDGGYLEFRCPGVRPYADSRFIDVALVDEFFKAVRRPAEFRHLQNRVGFDAVLLPVVDSREVIVSLLRDPDWKLAYADSARAFLANRRSAAGAAATVREPLFYGGEDLTIPRYALAAIEWITVLAQVGDRDNLLRALQQFFAAPQVPAGLVEVALSHGLKNNDAEVAAAARALSPKMISLRPIDRDTVDWLLSRPSP